MTWINGKNNNSNSNNNTSVKTQATTVSKSYNKNNIFPGLRQKTTFEGVNPMACASPKVLQRAQNFRNQRKAATAKVNAKRNKSLNAYKATTRKNRKTRKNRRTRRN
jgi:hypothetical protein